jgi:hypothetical protein
MCDWMRAGVIAFALEVEEANPNARTLQETSRYSSSHNFVPGPDSTTLPPKESTQRSHATNETLDSGFDSIQCNSKYPALFVGLSLVADGP